MMNVRRTIGQKYKVSLIGASSRFRISASSSRRVLYVITITIPYPKDEHTTTPTRLQEYVPICFSWLLTRRAPFNGRSNIRKVNDLSCQLAFPSLNPSVFEIRRSQGPYVASCPRPNCTLNHSTAGWSSQVSRISLVISRYPTIMDIHALNNCPQLMLFSFWSSNAAFTKLSI